MACRLFMSVVDANHVAKLGNRFHMVASGIISVPIDIPGTPFNKAIKAAKAIRKELLQIIRQRKVDLGEGKASATQDILSHMLTTCDENGQFMNELDIADKILGLLIGGHDTASVACTFIVKFLAELPHIYHRVYQGHSLSYYFKIFCSFCLLNVAICIISIFHSCSILVISCASCEYVFMRK